MTKATNTIASAMFLAAGTFASSASAVTQTFNYNPVINAFGTSMDVNIGGNSTAQFTYSSATAKGSTKNLLNTVGNSGVGTNRNSPPANDTYVSNAGVFFGPASAEQYINLKFDIGGVTQYGVASISPTATLDSITYDSAVTEPAVWAELITGFGMVGGLARVGRRRQRSLVSA